MTMKKNWIYILSMFASVLAGCIVPAETETQESEYQQYTFEIYFDTGVVDLLVITHSIPGELLLSDSAFIPDSIGFVAVDVPMDFQKVNSVAIGARIHSQLYTSTFSIQSPSTLTQKVFIDTEGVMSPYTESVANDTTIPPVSSSSRSVLENTYSSSIHIDSSIDLSSSLTTVHESLSSSIAPDSMVHTSSSIAYTVSSSSVLAVSAPSQEDPQSSTVYMSSEALLSSEVHLSSEMAVEPVDATFIWNFNESIAFHSPRERDEGLPVESRSLVWNDGGNEHGTGVRFAQSQVSVNEGSLQLSINKGDAASSYSIIQKKYMNPGGYMSGSVLTPHSLYGYGTYEIRAKVPPHSGYSALNFTLSNRFDFEENFQEIGVAIPTNSPWYLNDIIAFVGNSKGITPAASYDSLLFYSFETPRDHQNNTTELHKTWTHNDGEWHTYTIQWTAAAIEWYVDGNKVYTFNDGYHNAFDHPILIPDAPLSISVHLYSNGWMGVYPADDELPLTAEIDWMSYTAPES